jgi:hypothetical protein
MQKTNRKNKKWLKNRDQIKTPKIFSVNMVRLPNGNFHLVGGGSKVYLKRNQYRVDPISVDVRDLAVEMNNSKILAF